MPLSLHCATKKAPNLCTTTECCRRRPSLLALKRVAANERERSGRIALSCPPGLHSHHIPPLKREKRGERPAHTLTASANALLFAHTPFPPSLSLISCPLCLKEERRRGGPAPISHLVLTTRGWVMQLFLFFFFLCTVVKRPSRKMKKKEKTLLHAHQHTTLLRSGSSMLWS